MSSDTPSSHSIRLDDLYRMVAHIYSEKNAERPVSVTLSHLVEVCGMLTMHSKKKNREDVSLEDALCKALGWYFPLLAKVGVRSAEDLIFRKFPQVCPYCRLRPHVEKNCKQAGGTLATVNHPALRGMYLENKHSMPVSLNQWQEMFNGIYPRDLRNTSWSVVSLFEEIGELSEAVRVFETHPKYFAGEAADVFSYIMGIANEHALIVQEQITSGVQRKPFDFEHEFLRRYPGLCPQCGYQVCVCPVIPEATIGRMAKELDVIQDDPLFSLLPQELTARAIQVCTNILRGSGDGAEILNRLPFDRGDVNRAMIVLCAKVADEIRAKHPAMAKELVEIAVRLGSNPMRPGTRTDLTGIDNAIVLLKKAWRLGGSASLFDGSTIASSIAGQFSKEACTIGIVTALPCEFAAMQIMLEDSSNYSVPADPNEYVVGKIPSADGLGVHWVIVTLLKQIGNNMAAAGCTNLIRSFENVKEILMVGIAGGIPRPRDANKHVRRGDIIVANEEGIIQYDNLRETINKIQVRSNVGKPSGKILGKVKKLEAERLSGKYPWKKHIEKGRALENAERPKSDLLFAFENDEYKEIDHPEDPNRKEGEPRIHYGRIGAANKLLRNPKLRDKLAADHNVIAIEMGSSGIADAAWTHNQPYTVIRGVSDYCDDKKDEAWHMYAAIVAAAYARTLIESLQD